jgi:hypothetical protein
MNHDPIDVAAWNLTVLLDERGPIEAGGQIHEIARLIARNATLKAEEISESIGIDAGILKLSIAREIASGDEPNEWLAILDAANGTGPRAESAKIYAKAIRRGTERLVPSIRSLARGASFVEGIPEENVLAAIPKAMAAIAAA